MTVLTPRQMAQERATPQERTELGRSMRSVVPRSAHRSWEESAGRGDPITLLERQNAQRVPWLVPLRHGRMSASPFAFYRGTAKIMASDLASTPTSGLSVQLGGDAHLSNYGAYASPERQLLFDANDFDETLPGPFEWDLKRLATSFTVAAGDLGFRREDRRVITEKSVEAYRRSMTRYAAMGYLDRWYDHLAARNIADDTELPVDQAQARIDRIERKARSKTSLQALGKLAVEENGTYRIRSDPPVLFPLRELPSEYDPQSLEESVHAAFAMYKDTLANDRRCLLDRFKPVDIGVKVVGVGSVGTRCLIILLQGRDHSDPLFLQIKEAGKSVLEEYLTESEYPNEGQRVVEGQRLTQAQSDIFLGWTEGGIDGDHFYIRQLRDWKRSADIETMTPSSLSFYADLCGRTMARGPRAHW